MPNFRSTTVSTTGALIKNSAGEVRSVNLVNRHSAAIFVKFYDQSVSGFQDTPLRTYQIAANANLTTVPERVALFGFVNALTVRAVTGATDNDNTAPATLPIIEVDFN